ncbi:MAG: hypothetical protein LBS54_08680 [Dysgonamonadaceae bacterium]|jgi:hypothetical protein|nr:hypothetical protein [Dysgonamonadaceae bacterium]
MTCTKYRVKQLIEHLCHSKGKIIFLTFALFFCCESGVAQLHIAKNAVLGCLDSTQINKEGIPLIYDSRSKKFKPVRYKSKVVKEITPEKTQKSKGTCAKSGYSVCFKHAPLNGSSFSSGSTDHKICINPTKRHTKLYAVAVKRIGITVILDGEPIYESPSTFNNCTNFSSAQVTRPPPAV